MFLTLDPRNDLGRFPRILNREVYYPGQIIIEQGTIANRAFYIESGVVEVVVKDGDHSMVVSTLSTGDIFGEMALIEHCVRTATVRAVEETVVTEIAKDELEAKINALEDKSIRGLIHVFARRLRQANQSQFLQYKHFAEFQDRIAGLVEKSSDTHLSQQKRESFRREVTPLLDELERVLEKYRQQDHS